MRTKTFFTVLIMHFILLANLGFTQSVNCNLEEWVALRVLYGSTDGDNWTNNTGWEIVNTSTIPQFCNLESLYGVTTRDVCAVEDVGIENCIFPQGVIDISLENNNLNGAIPPLIANLFYLESLKLSGNSLTGSLPKEIGILSNLQYLATNDNQLDGCYDDELKQLCNQLTNIDFQDISDGNNFDASWEDFCEIEAGICPPLPASNCRQTDSLALIKIYESINADALVDFSQPMDNWLGITLNENGCVDKLELNNLNLNGEIPSQIGDLGEITVIDLSNNNITGSLPSEIGNLTNLVGIVLRGNDFTGPLPSSIGNLINLSGIDIDGNQFTEIPESIGNLSQLIIFSARDNSISFIPETIGELINLNLLFLDFNNLTELPSSIQGLNLFTLFVNDNQITGPLPVWLAEMGPQFTFQVHNNQFSGCYAEEFSPLCIQIPPFFNSNANISDGNNFDVSWEDFCATGVGTCVAQQPENCRQTDSLALIEIYKSLNADALVDFSQPMDNWFGVLLNNNGCVDSLLLPNLNLSGELATEIGDLSEIVYINLDNNDIFGSLPSSIGNLTNLTSLNIGSNNFSGPIPSSIGNLKNVFEINIFNNQFTEIPESFVNLSELTLFNANFNNISSIPETIGELSKLTLLLLGSNNLMELPASIGNINLLSLNVSNNEITGSLPIWLTELNQLFSLEIQNNQLSGCYAEELKPLCSQLPPFFNSNANISDGNNFDASWEDFCATDAGACIPQQPLNCRQTDSLALIEIYKSLNADYLVDFSQPIDNWYGVFLNEKGCVDIFDLFSLDLDGELPREIGNLSELIYLNLMFNNISGSIPSEIGNLENLVFLSLDYNNLEGPIPATIGNLNNLLGLYVSDNQLTGPLPIWLSEMQALSDLRVENNQLSGCYGDELKQLCNDSFSYRNSNISNGNNFDAAWEDFCYTGAGSCIPQEPSSCRQTDSLALIAIYQSLNATDLVDFSQPIDDWVGVILNEKECVDGLELSNLNLSGEIPAEIGNLSEITFISFSNNNITGSLPEEIGFLSKLNVLDLNSNQIEYIPETIGKLNNLTYLFLNGNKLTELPSTMGNLNNLTTLLLIDNQLTGQLPTWLIELEQLFELQIQNNQLSGCYTSELKQLCNEPNILDDLVISEGNNFDANWEDFCATGAGGCDLQPQSCRQTDSLALIKVFNSFGLAIENDLPIDFWPGVYLNENGCVDRLELADFSLFGEIDPAIGDLSEIITIELSGNLLAGVIPSTIGNLTNLQYLNLNNNQLESIPSTIGDLAALEFLGLYFNSIGEIPASIGNLSNLRNLDIGYNFITEIPASIGNLSNLQYLDAGYNPITYLPESIGNLSSLNTLYLDFTIITQLPATMGNLKQLQNFIVNDNQIEGELPAWLADMDALEVFYINNNKLSGCYDVKLKQLCSQLSTAFNIAISDGNNFDASWEDFCTTGASSCISQPQSCHQTDSLALIEIYKSLNADYLLDFSQPIDNWYGVSVNENGCVDSLFLSNKELSGTISSYIGDLSEVVHIEMADNFISGSIPSEIGNLSNLIYLDLGNNNISALPTTIGNLTSLEFLEIANNQLTEIPASIGNLRMLYVLDASYNQIEYLPDSMSNMGNLLYLYINDNQIKGQLSAWLANVSDIFQRLTIQNNQLEGCYPDELKQLCDELDPSFNINRYISDGNNFDASWENFCATETGSCIPPSASCRQTDSLALIKVFNSFGLAMENDLPIDFWPGVYLNENGCVDQLVLPDFFLFGEIDPAIGDLSEIITIDLSENLLAGVIPSTIGNLTNLQYLNLNNNQLESIPSTIGDLAGLEFLGLNYNLIGEIPASIVNLSNLRNLDIGYNFITEIPASIGNLSNLQYLDASYNPITYLPESIGNLSSLNTLYLDYTIITQLPATMGNLKQLQNFIVNDNQIEGELPAWLADMEALEVFYINNNKLSGCYDVKLKQLCSQLLTAFNIAISDGNNFDATWEDFCATGAGSCAPQPSNCRQTDSLALITIYQSLKPNHTWDLSTPLDNWPGVRIINENGCVDKLDLSERGLWGVIPPEIGDLSEITFLRMVENEITGFLPAEIGNLTTLKVLSLADNNMSGSIPNSLRNLTNLEALYLSQNQFTEVPIEIGNFDKLTELFLSINQLSGCYPSEFAQLCDQLKPNSNSNFAISDGNNFNATWEDFCATGAASCQTKCNIDDWTALKALYESTNGDNWTNRAGWDAIIDNQNSPPANCDLSELDGIFLDEEERVSYAYLWFNNLQGEIPPEIGMLNNLEGLWLSGPNNQLTGSIPREIGMLSNLKYLIMDNNELSGFIPTEIGKLNNLVSLVLSNNNLNGKIPYQISFLSNLEDLLLDGNQLSDEIPAELSKLDKLYNLVLLNNELSGCYADELKQLCGQVSPTFSLFIPGAPVDAIAYGNNFEITWEDFCAGVECIDFRTSTNLGNQKYQSNNYPNPFNTQTSINYTLSSDSRVTISVYNSTGKRVEVLYNNERQEAGNHSVIFRGDNMPAGVYYYRISSGDFDEMKKMVLIK